METKLEKVLDNKSGIMVGWKINKRETFRFRIWVLLVLWNEA